MGALAWCHRRSSKRCQRHRSSSGFLGQTERGCRSGEWNGVFGLQECQSGIPPSWIPICVLMYVMAQQPFASTGHSPYPLCIQGERCHVQVG